MNKPLSNPPSSSSTNSPAEPQPSRRHFLKTSAAASAALAVPYFVPASSLGQDGRPAPSERIVMGCVGTGGKGRHNMGTFLTFKDLQVVAVCDVDTNHRAQAKKEVDDAYKTADCVEIADFRELCSREDIDVVSVATPDHWHALPTVAALNAGKDVYCEKPLTNSIGEGRAICKAAAANEKLVQTGSHERSHPNARLACELVRNGRIGKLHTMRVHLPCDEGHHKEARRHTTVPEPVAVPENLNWDMWLGHTAEAPYHPLRCHFWWRFILAYGGGEMTDRGAHVIDLAQLGAGKDDSGPVHVEAKGVASATSLYDTFFDYLFVNQYDDGVTMIGDTSGPRGVRFEGSEGWVFIHVHGCHLEASDPKLLETNPEEFEIKLGRSPVEYEGNPLPNNGHHRNFVDCVKTREQPLASAEIGHRTATICHLNNISMKLGRKLIWDPVKEEVQNDAEANALLMPTMREPWTLS